MGGILVSETKLNLIQTEPTMGDCRLIYDYYSYVLTNGNKASVIYLKLLQVLPKLFEGQCTQQSLQQLIKNKQITISVFVNEGQKLIKGREGLITGVYELFVGLNDLAGTEILTNKGNGVTEAGSMAKLLHERSQLYELYKNMVVEGQVFSFSELDNTLLSDFVDYMETVVDREKQIPKMLYTEEFEEVELQIRK